MRKCGALGPCLQSPDSAKPRTISDKARLVMKVPVVPVGCRTQLKTPPRDTDWEAASNKAGTSEAKPFPVRSSGCACGCVHINKTKAVVIRGD